MNATKGSGVRAASTAALLLAAGMMLGVLVDRLWLVQRPLGATPLTAQEMAAHLELGPQDEARIRGLLDSIGVEVAQAAAHGPDSVRAAARRGHMRIEAALPDATRGQFRDWMQAHHNEMMRRMGGMRMHAPPHDGSPPH